MTTKTIEAVTKAILFEDCGNTEDWRDNINLGQAAFDAIMQSPEIQRVIRDAERYRWLRSNHSAWGRIEMGHDETMPVNMDAVIDAAMEQQV